MQALLQEHLQTIANLQQRIDDLRGGLQDGKDKGQALRRIMGLQAMVGEMRRQAADIRDYIER